MMMSKCALSFSQLKSHERSSACLEEKSMYWADFHIVLLLSNLVLRTNQYALLAILAGNPYLLRKNILCLANKKKTKPNLSRAR